MAGEDGGDVVDGQGAHGVAGGFAGAGGVRGQDQAVDVQQCGVDVGFVFEDVQGGAAETPVAQGRDERGFVDDSAAGGVDQVGAGFHRGQRRVVDQVVGLRGERGVHRHHVAVGEQGGGVDEGDAVLGGARGGAAAGGEDSHVEGQRPLGDGAPDAAVTEDAQGSAGAEVQADEHPGPPDPGLPGADEPVALGDAPGGGQDQGEGVVGAGPVEHAGGVGDGDTGGVRRGQVDVVVADGDVRDGLQLRSGGREQVGVDLLGEGD